MLFNQNGSSLKRIDSFTVLVTTISSLAFFIFGVGITAFFALGAKISDVGALMAAVGTVATLFLLIYQNSNLKNNHEKLEKEKYLQNKISLIKQETESLNKDIQSYNTIILKLFQLRQAISTELIQQSRLFDNNNELLNLKNNVLNIINNPIKNTVQESDITLLNLISNMEENVHIKIAKYLSSTANMEVRTSNILTSNDALNSQLFITKYPLRNEKIIHLITTTCNSSDYLDSSRRLLDYTGVVSELNELTKGDNWNTNAYLKLSSAVSAHISYLTCLSRELYQYSDSIYVLQEKLLPQIKTKRDYLDKKIETVIDLEPNMSTDNICYFPNITNVENMTVLSKDEYRRQNSNKIFISD